jgi:hypothetical protein
MIVTTHIRRLTVTALIGCVMLIGWSSAALARPIDDPALNTSRHASTAPESPGSSTGGQRDETLPILLGGAFALILVGAGGYAYRARTGRRVTA